MLIRITLVDPDSQLREVAMTYFGFPGATAWPGNVLSSSILGIETVVMSSHQQPMAQSSHGCGA